MRALKARITSEDESLVRKFLTPQEQILFYRQRIADQFHALCTTKHILDDIEDNEWINRTRIIKMALLHDIGKINVFMPLWVRPAAVLLKKFVPRIYKWLVKKGNQQNTHLIYKYFYTYEEHPQIGETFLREIQTEKEVITLVRMHHDQPSPNDPKELPIFRRADNA